MSKNSAESRIRNAGVRYMKSIVDKHGDLYDYSKTVYQGRHKKITVVCRKHGPFTIEAGSHLLGSGCDTCYQENRRANNKKDKDKFESDSRIKYGDFYDYSKVDYVSCKDEVIIVCPVHGEFSQTPDAHLQQEHGCPDCAKIRVADATRKTPQQFLIDLETKYPLKFEVLGEYSGAAKEIEVRCPVCSHVWSPTPTRLLGGKGCPKCAKMGYDLNKPSELYTYDLGDFVGFGKTNNFKSRSQQHRKTFARMGVYATHLTRHEGSGEIISALENHLKKTLPIADSGIPGFKTEAVLKEHQGLLFESIKQFMENQ